jgi:hypothetical protein
MGAEEEDFLEVQVGEVIRDPRTNQPIVILTDLGGNRGMPIWIGEAEAFALQAARLHLRHRRPLTHELMAGILQSLEARVLEVRITELKENIYYARIRLRSESGVVEVDSRPSDAMVLALRMGCPIRVSRTLFEAQSAPLEKSTLERYGLEVQPLTPELGKALGFEGKGLLVSHVISGSQAEADGLNREDILIRVAGKPVHQVKDLTSALEETEKEVRVFLFRKGRTLTLSLHPAAAP